MYIFVKLLDFFFPPTNHTVSIVFRQASNLLFVDQPVGTGFSYSADEHDIRHDEGGVSDDLYDFLQVCLFPMCVVCAFQWKKKQESWIHAWLHVIKICQDMILRFINFSTLSQAFFKEHPQFAKNDFYITGESYAGHYIPAFAARVHQGNKAKEGININLKVALKFTIGCLVSLHQIFNSECFNRDLLLVMG